MVAVGIEMVILVVLLILSIGLQLEARFSAKDYLDGYDSDLQEMRNALEVVAAVMNKLPEMMPQMNLINQNPLTQILEFFQNRAQAEQGSLGAERLRDDNGAYSDGKKEAEKK
jgi:hypothetical protein